MSSTNADGVVALRTTRGSRHAGGVDAPPWRHVLARLPRVRILCVTISHLFLVSVFPIPVSAQGAPPQTAAQQTLNPLANEIVLEVTPSLEFSAGPHLDALGLEFVPRGPIGLTEDWRVVTRSHLSISHLLGNEETTGLGDLDVAFFLTPARATKWMWGAGPIIQLPTATDVTEGTGKWSTGPTAALVYINGPWDNGVVVSHLWSVAGPSSARAWSRRKSSCRSAIRSRTTRTSKRLRRSSTIGEPPPGKTGSFRLMQTSDDSSRSSQRRSACRSARTTTSHGRMEPPRGCSSQSSGGSIDSVDLLKRTLRQTQTNAALPDAAINYTLLGTSVTMTCVEP
jgi:hypothetical protein